MDNMAITNNLNNINEVLSELDIRYRTLWNNLLYSDDGIDGKTYGALIDLGEIICPEFVKYYSCLVDATDGRFYSKEKI